MTAKKDALHWFELHVTDLARAKRFYETILKTSLQDIPAANPGECAMALFPYDNASGIGGALTKRPEAVPGAGGTLIYLNVEGDLDGVLKRIPGAGGTILKPNTAIGEHGFIGLFKDTEGNIVGLHSQE